MASMVSVLCGLMMLSLASGMSEDFNVTALKEEMESLKSRITEQDYEINVMKSMFHDLQAQQVNTRGELTRTKSELRTTTQDVANLKTTASRSTVAFSVSGPQSEASYSRFRGTLIFSSTYLDTTSNYNSATGQFTCPRSGYYLFSYNVITYDLQDGEFVSVELKVGGSSKRHAFCKHEGPHGSWMNCGGTTVVQCDSGQAVWVEKTGGNGWIAWDSSSWFTGILLRSL